MPIPINYQQSGVLCSEVGDFVQAKKKRTPKVSKAVGEIDRGYVGRETCKLQDCFGSTKENWVASLTLCHLTM